jgi:glycosyltransferase involved in cell wall biosynthesis
MTKTIITLTTIPPRFPYLGETLRSLLSQDAKIDAIELWVPRTYKRFSFDVAKDLPKVPEGVNIRLAQQDMGPATKILPAVSTYTGHDVNLLFCDDDKIYDPKWATRLLSASIAHPGCCIVEEGGDLKHNSEHNWCGSDQPRAERIKKGFNYRLKRAISFGTWKPRKSVSSGYTDILEGWGGVLVRPEFFTQRAFDIHPDLWMIDDIWLSGQLAINNVKIWLTFEPGTRAKGNSNEAKKFALRTQVVEGKGRTALNQNGIDYFRDKHDIWK